MKDYKEIKETDKKRVLLFSNTTYLSSLRRSFSLAGADIVYAVTHEEALKALGENQFSHIVIDTQIMDLDRLDQLQEANLGFAKVVVLSYRDIGSEIAEKSNQGFDIRFVNKNNLLNQSVQPQDLLS